MINIKYKSGTVCKNNEKVFKWILASGILTKYKREKKKQKTKKSIQTTNAANKSKVKETNCKG